MNIMYLSLYGVAAVVLAVVFIRTCLERDKMTWIVCLTEMLALICVVAYSVNFITDNYRAMSVATSIMMAAQDFALVALLTYTGVFTDGPSAPKPFPERPPCASRRAGR